MRVGEGWRWWEGTTYSYSHLLWSHKVHLRERGLGEVEGYPGSEVKYNLPVTMG